MGWKVYLLALLGCAPSATMSGDTGSPRLDSSVMPAHDAGVDVTPMDDGAIAPDALDSCEPCIARNECWTATCIAGRCVEEAVDDTTACGELGWHCVRGSCRERGCGDGYREPGPVPAREACDDANDDANDTCDSCWPRIATIASESNGWAETIAAPTVAAHTNGAALVAWVDERWVEAEPTWTWLAQRFDYAGAPIGDAIPIAPNLPVGWGGACSVAAIVPGWVVVCDAPEGIIAREIDLDGTAGPALLVADEGWMPRAGAIDDDFEIAWSDGEGLKRRRYDTELGSPVESERMIVAGPIGYLALTSTPTHRALAWSADGNVYVRVHDHDERVVVSAMVGQGSEVALALDDARVVAAWSTRSADSQGDVQARVIEFDGELGPIVEVANRVAFAEAAPTVATIGDGFVVGWHERGSHAGASLASFGVEVPELDLARNAVMPPGDQSGLVLATGQDENAWALWSAGAPFGESGALRSVFMTLVAEGER